MTASTTTSLFIMNCGIVLACTGVILSTSQSQRLSLKGKNIFHYRLKPMLETASRIHSANGGVRASQARDVGAAAFADAACISGAIIAQVALRGAVWKPPKDRAGCKAEQIGTAYENTGSRLSQTFETEKAEAIHWRLLIGGENCYLIYWVSAAATLAEPCSILTVPTWPFPVIIDLLFSNRPSELPKARLTPLTFILFLMPRSSTQLTMSSALTQHALSQ